MTEPSYRIESAQQLAHLIGRLPRVVAITAAAGIDGLPVAREVADRLGLELVHDQVPVRVAERLGASVDDAIALDGRAPSRLARAFQCAANGTIVPELIGVGDELWDVERFGLATDEVLREVADTGGVVLGRAGPFVLAGHPRLLSVRLTAPLERRVERVAVAHGFDRRAARRLLRRADRYETDYARHRMVDRDLDDPANYDLCVDALSLEPSAVVGLIAAAAR